MCDANIFVCSHVHENLTETILSLVTAYLKVRALVKVKKLIVCLPVNLAVSIPTTYYISKMRYMVLVFTTVEIYVLYLQKNFQT